MSIKKGNKVIAGAPIEPVWGTISGDITDQADLQAALAEKVGANSPAFIGTPTAPTPPVGSYDDRIATTSYVQQAIESVDALPSQAGHNGQFLTTDGTDASWATVDALPSQSGQSGKFLTTNGTTASWSDLTGVVKLNGGNTQQTIQLTSGSGTTPLGVKSMSTGSYISFSGTGGWLGSYGVTSTKQPTFYNGTSYTLAFKDELGDVTALTTTTKTSAVAAINELNSNALKTKTVIQNMNTHGRADRLWFSEIHDVLYRADKRFTVTSTGFTSFLADRLFNGSFEDYSCKIEAGNTGVIEISGSSITGVYRSGYIFVSFYSSWSPHTADQVAITIENAGGNVATLTPEAWETKGSGASSYVTVVRAEVPSLSTANAISKITITITNNGSGDICPTEIEYFLSRPSSIELIPAVTKYGNNTIYGNLTVDSIIKSGGTASQFLKANGTVDSTAYAPLASPSLSGTPTAPTADAGTNTTQIATTEFVQTAINSIDALPTQAGNNGKFLTTDGTNASWATITIPTYTSGTGISISGTTINHSNSITAGTAGTSSATSGSTLAVPYITYDAQGHITTSGTHTHTVTGFLTSNDVTSTYSSTGTAPVNGTAVASAISTKQDNITGAATTITSSNLTASRALISNSSGKVSVSSVTSTELGYLSGVTSAIQTQLDDKQRKIVAGTDLEILIHPDSLPSEYIALSYLEGNGTVAYIDTGVKVNTLVSPKIVTRFQMVNSGDYDYFGTSSNSPNTIIYDIIPSNPVSQYIRWGTTGYTRFSGSTASLDFSNNFHTLEIGGNDIKAENPVIVDGIQIAVLNADSTASLSHTGNILIFRARSNAGTSRFAYFTIYSNGLQVFNGIPAKRKSDGVLGMYDTVSNTFKTSAGTGTFTGGVEYDGDIINFTNSSGYALKSYVDTNLSYKQATLVSGTNIKTINNTSILGSGNIDTHELPSQTGQSGKYLATDGSTVSWESVPSNLPSQTGQSGKFLTTNGTDASWASFDESDLVHKSGNETITGTKSFESTLQLKNNLSFRSYGTNDSGRLQFRAQPSDNVIRGTVAITDGYSTSGSGYTGFVAQMVAREGSTTSEPFNTMRVSNKGIEYIKEANDGTITGQYILIGNDGIVPQARLASGGTNGQVLMTNGTTASWADASGSTITYWEDD